MKKFPAEIVDISCSPSGNQRKPGCLFPGQTSTDFLFEFQVLDNIPGNLIFAQEIIFISCKRLQEICTLLLDFLVQIS